MNTIELNKLNFKKYEDQYPNKGRLRFEDNNTGDFLIKDNKLVGLYEIDKDRKYITALEVLPEFQGNGYSRILLRLAILRGATSLSVRSSNIRAIKIYTKYGFKVVERDNYMLYMKYDDTFVPKARTSARNYLIKLGGKI